MKPEPSGDTDRRRPPWQGFIGTVLVLVVSVGTVLGAVLLSMQGQAQSQRALDDTPMAPVPTTVVATLPSPTLMPTQPVVDTLEPAGQVQPTTKAPALTETSSPTPKALATATALRPSAVPPSATPWPCAGFAPMAWELYTVQPGDTLFSLARRHGTSQYDVIYYNCLTSDQLWAGQRLYLPAAPTAIPMATPTASATPTWSPTPPMPSATSTPPATATPTLTAIPSPTITATLTASPEPSGTPSATDTATPTPDSLLTPTSSPTASPTPSATPTVLPTETTSPTPSPSPTPTPTETAQP